MKNEPIKDLILSLDDTSPYLREIRRRFFPRKRKLSTSERLVYPMSDPSFRWHFSAAYYRGRVAIPNQVWDDSIWRAFCCLEGDARCWDTDCHDAIALNHPANRCKQILLKALWCSEMKREAIADYCGISVRVLQLYYDLFFDFRDRKDDRSFLLKVLNPRGELMSFKAGNLNGQDRALTLMHIGFKFGADAVLKELGMHTNQQTDLRSDAEVMGAAKRALLLAAETKAQLGLLTNGDAGYGLLKVVAGEYAKHEAESIDEDARMGLTSLSMSEGAMSVFKRIVTAAAAERQRNAQIYDAQRAAEEAKRKMATTNANPA